MSISETLTQVQVSQLELREALRHDPEFFIQFFLADQLSHDVPAFHKDIFFEMTHDEIDRLVLAIPRAHAKTTLAKLACVWYLLFSDFRFVLYVSGSHDLVVPYVNDIAGFFESENFTAVFGEVIWLKKQDGIGVYKFKIPSLGKTCILRGLGAGQRIRGINVDNERPQLAICDDIENDEDVENDIVHKKHLKWFYGQFFKCLNQFKNKIIVSGNLLAKTSVLYKLLTSDRWRSYLYGAIKCDGQPLWPDLWPLEKLTQDYLEYQEAGMAERWFAEMMNQPTAAGGGLIKAEEICYMPPVLRDGVKYGFITIDPATTANSWGDRAAIIAHAWVPEHEQWQIVEARYEYGQDPIDLFKAAIEMATSWGFRNIGVESEAMQSALTKVFMFLQGIFNVQQFNFIPITSGNVAKSVRIAAWASLLKQSPTRRAQYSLPYGDFVITQQLLNYEPKKKDNDDDVIDACAMGVFMIERHIGEIMRDFEFTSDGSAQSLVGMAEV